MVIITVFFLKICLFSWTLLIGSASELFYRVHLQAIRYSTLQYYIMYNRLTQPHIL